MAFFARLAISLLLLGIQPLIGETLAQDFPNRPIRIVNGASPEIVPRIFAKKITDALNQAVVVESIPGAGGKLAADAVAKSKPDGHTLFHVTATYMIYLAQERSAGDVSRDYVPVAMGTYTPFVLIVNSALPVNTVQELVALAKAKPGELNYGASAGFPHFAFELLKKMAKVNIVYIPYKRSDDVVAAILSGQVHATFTPNTQAAGLSKSGKARTLAVAPGQRSRSLPDVPTLAETGFPGYDLLGWTGFVAPLGTPPAVVVKLNAIVRKALGQAEVQEQISRVNQDLGSDFSPEQFAEFLKAETLKWRKLVNDIGFKIG
ncbi:MAG: tripartite tricarboxylate transporter substrate binding protein [Betaproteobacteria bacterium]|nr:tripartite tricarboxylate transporter substrate binding protein [Betaproteobacteria bacterium]